MSRSLVLAMAAAISGAVGCSDITAPVDDFELPEPSTSLEVDRLVVGGYVATPCAFAKSGDRLAHLRDRDEWTLVDVFFGRTSPSDSAHGPTAADLARVRAHRGRILHVFNVPAVRARIPLSRLPDLVRPGREGEGRWITVRDVPDASRYDLEVSVGFRRPLRDADIDLIEELGGRVTYRFDSINGLSGILPDRSLPELRASSDVLFVEVPGVYCLA